MVPPHSYTVSLPASIGPERVKELTKWIKDTWPGVYHGSYINSRSSVTDDFRIYYMTTTVKFEFADVSKATLFKMTWGGI